MRLDKDGLGASCNGAALLSYNDSSATLGAGAGAGGAVADGGTLGFVASIPSFPSGSSRFVVRRQGARYFSLTNPVDMNRTNTGTTPDPCGQRNHLALAVSSDLLEWRVCEIVLTDDTGLAHAKHVADASFLMVGFQCECIWLTLSRCNAASRMLSRAGYIILTERMHASLCQMVPLWADVHWQFDGEDVIYAVRAAYRGATDAGQANRYLFGRLTGFAQRCQQPGT
jgi:hypothetical protein